LGHEESNLKTRLIRPGIGPPMHSPQQQKKKEEDDEESKGRDKGIFLSVSATPPSLVSIFYRQA